MLQTLLLLGMIILAYLVSRMTHGYTQMVRELKYLRSKIHTGHSFQDNPTDLLDDSSSDAFTNKDNNTQSISTATSTSVTKSKNNGGGTYYNKIEPQHDNTQSGGGGTIPSITDAFNSFHLPDNIQNYIPILKRLDIEKMTGKDDDIYEAFNSSIYNSNYYSDKKVGGTSIDPPIPKSKILTETQRTLY